MENRETDSEMDPEALPLPKQSSSPQQSTTVSHSGLLQRTPAQMWFMDSPPSLEHLNLFKSSL